MTARSGMSLIELIVAATLIISGLAVIGKLTVLSGRMWQQTHHERVAIEELSNQLERLIALPPRQREAEIAERVPSSHAAELLPGAELTVRSLHDSDGIRLEMQLDSDRGTPSSPITLVGWIDVVESVPSESQEPSP